MEKKNKFDCFCERVSEKTDEFFGIGSSKLCRAEKKLFFSNRINCVFLLVIALASFFAMYYMNCKTPYGADDYCYRYIFSNGVMKTTDTKVETFHDIFISMREHYYYMNGRIILHSIVQFMLTIDKSVFNVINSLVYVLLTFAIYFNCIGKKFKQHNALLFLTVNLAIWSFIKQWGMTTLWVTGSINYMWGSTIRLLALLPFRFYADDGEQKLSVPKAILMLFIGILAGGTNENMSGAFIGMVILFAVYYRIRRFKFRAFIITTLVGAVPSLIFMVTAPGNFSRVDRITETGKGNPILKRFVNIPGNAILNLSAIFLFVFICAVLLWHFNRKKNTCRFASSFIFLLGSLAGLAVMVVSPYFPPRAWFGIIIAGIVSAGNLLVQIELLPNMYRRIFVSLAIVWMAVCSMQFVLASRDAKATYQIVSERVAYINQQKEIGNLSLEVKRVIAENPHEPLYDMTDVSYDKTSWQNESMAKFYGIKEIVRIPDITK
ncbi:MAG TPA: hypothetical protein DDY98_06795 [Ruminococcaceae bacterium]|nr:hypothetical protein [Oscillospiraceae bacterium]